MTDAPPELLKWLESLEEWAIRETTKSSEKLFKGKTANDPGECQPCGLGDRALLGADP